MRSSPFSILASAVVIAGCTAGGAAPLDTESSPGVEAGSGSVPALVLPARRDFDAVAVSSYDEYGASAWGSSNGVGWAICNTHFSSCCGANTTDTYTGFDTADFAPPVAAEDDVHITQADFVLVFEQPVERVVFYLRENYGTASLDFGLPPTVLSGGANLTITGTRVHPDMSGGAVVYDDIGSATMTHTSVVFDGMNVAFYVEALAPSAGPVTGDGSNLCANLTTATDGGATDDVPHSCSGG